MIIANYLHQILMNHNKFTSAHIDLYLMWVICDDIVLVGANCLVQRRIRLSVAYIALGIIPNFESFKDLNYHFRGRGVMWVWQVLMNGLFGILVEGKSSPEKITIKTSPMNPVFFQFAHYSHEQRDQCSRICHGIKCYHVLVNHVDTAP